MQSITRAEHDQRLGMLPSAERSPVRLGNVEDCEARRLVPLVRVLVGWVFAESPRPLVSVVKRPVESWLALVTDWSVWESSESFFMFDAWRRGAEGRVAEAAGGPGAAMLGPASLSERPGFSFDPRSEADREHAASLLALAALFGWGLKLTSPQTARRLILDHDGNVSVAGADDAAAAKLTATLVG